jgi:hypothetical protein
MAQLVFLSRLASSHQVSQRLVVGIRNPDWRQFAYPVTPRQFFCVSPIGFHAVPRFGRDQRWRDYLACHTHLGQLPVQNVSRRTGLVTGA